MSRLFLLSPARTTGARAQVLLSPRAQFDLAVQVRSPQGAALGDVFTFLSGLYFRGKLAYARHFARPPQRLRRRDLGGVFVITPSLGLQMPEFAVTPGVLEEFARVDIASANAAYRTPLETSARMISELAGSRAEVVLLGSIATGKYVDVLLDIFGDRLLFPADFVGRGDMSRGGLMLRCVRAEAELPYVLVKGAVRHGARPPRLEPIRYRRP